MFVKMGGSGIESMASPTPCLGLSLVGVGADRERRVERMVLYGRRSGCRGASKTMGTREHWKGPEDALAA